MQGLFSSPPRDLGLQLVLFIQACLVLYNGDEFLCLLKIGVNKIMFRQKIFRDRAQSSKLLSYFADILFNRLFTIKYSFCIKLLINAYPSNKLILNGLAFNYKVSAWALPPRQRTRALPHVLLGVLIGAYYPSTLYYETIYIFFWEVEVGWIFNYPRIVRQWDRTFL